LSPFLVYFQGDELLAVGRGQRTAIASDLPEDFFPTAAVSPDGEWIAYRYPRNGSSALGVVSSADFLEIAWQDPWTVDFEWVGKAGLLITGPDLSTGISYLLNPFSGTASAISPSYPGYVGDPLANPLWPFFRYFVPNQDFSFVAYMHLFTSVDGTSHDGISIWDNRRETVVWLKDYIDVERARPEWSPTEDVLAVAWNSAERLADGFHYEISLVDARAGEIQITKFSNVFREVAIWRLSWSNSGNSLAMWLDAPAEGETIGFPSLYLLEVESGRLVDLCVEGRASGLSPLLWSPDDRFLAFEADRSEIIVVDLTSSTSWSLGQGRAVGWMTNPPEALPKSP
jgi:hypothetical protein